MFERDFKMLSQNTPYIHILPFPGMEPSLHIYWPFCFADGNQPQISGWSGDLRRRAVGRGVGRRRRCQGG